MRQFAVCKFRPGDRRGYTYHNDGAPVAVGDRVTVDGPRGEGKMTVEVSEIGVPEPSFATKAILGLAPPPEAKSDPALGAAMRDSAASAERIKSGSPAQWPMPRGEAAQDAFDRDLDREIDGDTG